MSSPKLYVKSEAGHKRPPDCILLVLLFVTGCQGAEIGKGDGLQLGTVVEHLGDGNVLHQDYGGDNYMVYTLEKIYQIIHLNC